MPKHVSEDIYVEDLKAFGKIWCFGGSVKKQMPLLSCEETAVLNSRIFFSHLQICQIAHSWKRSSLKDESAPTDFSTRTSSSWHCNRECVQEPKVVGVFLTAMEEMKGTGRKSTQCAEEIGIKKQPEK